MIAYPGGDVDLYLDVTRNGEPVNSETQPKVVALWFNGSNLIGSPVTMSQLGTGLYFASVALSSSTQAGVYIAVMEFTRLGKTRRETLTVDVVVDTVASLTPAIADLADTVEGALPQNTRYEFIRAVANIPSRNVAAGRIDKIRFTHKRTTDTDYDDPVNQGDRLFVYDAIGDLNPVRVEGE